MSFVKYFKACFYTTNTAFLISILLMTRVSKIFASFLIVLHSASGFAIQDSEPVLQQEQQPSTGFVVFDANTFYAKPNTIVSYTNLTVIGTPEEEAFVLQTVTCKKMSAKNIENNIATTIKKIKRITKTVTVPNDAVVSKKTTADDLIFPFGTNPFDRNSVVSLLNNVGIGTSNPSKTNNKQQTITNYELQNSKFDQFCLVGRSRNTKQAFQTHEIAFTASNYSKTSRIRPPPSPEGGVANC